MLPRCREAAIVIVREWPDRGAVGDLLRRPPRRPRPRTSTRETGPSSRSKGRSRATRRELALVTSGDERRWRETTRYGWSLPWFRVLFALPVRWAIARRGAADPRRPRPRRTDAVVGSPRPPRDPQPADGARSARPRPRCRRASRQHLVHPRTVAFATDDFGVGDTGVAVGGSLVRVGIVLALPLAILADRIGRRVAWSPAVAIAAPLVSARRGARTELPGAGWPPRPSAARSGSRFDFLDDRRRRRGDATQQPGLPVSVLRRWRAASAPASRCCAPARRPLSGSSWRLVYLVALVWLVVDRGHRPPAPRDSPLRTTPRHEPRRSTGAGCLVLGLVALLANLFAWPPAGLFFQNGYLEDTRGFSATMIAVFHVLSTATTGRHRADHRTRIDNQGPAPC